MKVYVHTSEHFCIPGRRMTIHASRAGAVAALLESATIIVNDHNECHPDAAVDAPTADNWEDVFSALQDYPGAAYVYADIELFEVQS